MNDAAALRLSLGVPRAPPQLESRVRRGSQLSSPDQGPGRPPPQTVDPDSARQGLVRAPCLRGRPAPRDPVSQDRGSGCRNLVRRRGGRGSKRGRPRRNRCQPGQRRLLAGPFRAQPRCDACPDQLGDVPGRNPPDPEAPYLWMARLQRLVRSGCAGGCLQRDVITAIQAASIGGRESHRRCASHADGAVIVIVIVIVGDASGCPSVCAAIIDDRMAMKRSQNTNEDRRFRWGGGSWLVWSLHRIGSAMQIRHFGSLLECGWI
ncbi:uncharacterized protein BJ171DRAFT_517592 [Polychytrium aggregatum]|uniref:uncharacterized protein n=1 Tax=Polychytrium aggregatum TaxID=110093 RepID=UPI0022FF352C|nr:uncharacterized protein BJ171DRAFT_517592 [Polychytrium aggregatum]KAI9199710.1 hypothetical protein BJ171DRAFT_517592 [Polychytrium aggregatum]